MVVYNPYTKRSHPSPPLDGDGGQRSNKRPRPEVGEKERLKTNNSSGHATTGIENNTNINATSSSCQHPQQYRNIVRANTYEQDSKMMFGVAGGVAALNRNSSTATESSAPVTSSYSTSLSNKLLSSTKNASSCLHSRLQSSAAPSSSSSLPSNSKNQSNTNNARSHDRPQQQHPLPSTQKPSIVAPTRKSNPYHRQINPLAATSTSSSYVAQKSNDRIQSVTLPLPTMCRSSSRSNNYTARLHHPYQPSQSIGSSAASSKQNHSYQQQANLNAGNHVNNYNHRINSITNINGNEDAALSSPEVFRSSSLMYDAKTTEKSASNTQSSNDNDRKDYLLCNRNPYLSSSKTQSPQCHYQSIGKSSATTISSSSSSSIQPNDSTASQSRPCPPTSRNLSLQTNARTSAAIRKPLTTSTVASIRPSSWSTSKPVTDTTNIIGKTAATTTGQSTSAATSVNRSTPGTAPAQTKNGLGAVTRPAVSNKKQPELPGEPELPKQLKYTLDQMKPLEDEYRRQLVENANLSKPLNNGWTLFKHQKRAIIQGLVRRRMILALDMGLGKTLIGCVWSKAFKATYDNLKIIVVTPVSLKEEWKRTAENATGLAVESIHESSSSSKKTDPSSSSSSTNLDLQICSWAKVPTEIDGDVENFVVVFDEAHSIQSMEAARTKNSLELINSKRCVGVLLLTGTPMKNGKPSNLFPLLKAVRHPLGRHQKAYETHFCNGVKRFMKGRELWDASGCSNLQQLNRMVSTNLLHLTKEQCLEELPKLTREKRQVPISSRNQLQYIRAVKGLEIVDNRNQAGVLRDDQQDAVLGAMQRLRVLCAFSKVGATVEFAKGILEKEPAVVIFSNFAEVAKQVHDQLAKSGWEGELLTGQTPPKKRQGMVDKFQNGLSPVFVCTFGAGGVGLTLTAASTIILLDRPWTPGETRQAEDRVRRIGQTLPVKSIWMSAFDLDSQIDAMIESKVQATNAVLGSKTGGGGVAAVGSASKISISRLAASLLCRVNTASS